MKPAPLRAVAGGALLARVFGDRQPQVLALHGWGRDGADFAALLEGMAALAPDLPGFGHTPPPETVWGADDYARCVAPVLEDLRSPPVVLGHSFGGRVAVCLAARHPELVGGLILTGAPLVRTTAAASPRLSYRLVRWANRRGFLSDARLEAMRRKHGSPDYRAAQGVMRQVLVKVVNESYERQLDLLSTRVKLIWGADDRETPVEQARRIFDRLKANGCRVDLQVLSGAGHNLPLSRPEALREAIMGMREETHP